MKFAIATISAALIFGVGCSRPGPNAATTSDELKQDELKQAVQEKLASDAQLSHVQVSADASQNQVVLTGSVANEDERRTAVDLAKSVNATPSVLDNINVEPVAAASAGDRAVEQTREKAKEVGNKIGASIEDAWVYTSIEAKLVGHTAAPALKINVDVENNVVTLRGEVKTAEMKEQAERIARETAGVKEVRNLLQVRA